MPSLDLRILLNEEPGVVIETVLNGVHTAVSHIQAILNHCTYLSLKFNNQSHISLQAAPHLCWARPAGTTISFRNLASYLYEASFYAHSMVSPTEQKFSLCE